MRVALATVGFTSTIAQILLMREIVATLYGNELIFGLVLMALLAGLLTGLAFPLALALTRGSTNRAAGTLYGADLVGGCLGALIGAGLFIPVLGIPQTCAAIVLVGLAGLLVLIK